jgi:stress response protein YsnF
VIEDSHGLALLITNKDLIRVDSVEVSKRTSQRSIPFAFPEVLIHERGKGNEAKSPKAPIRRSGETLEWRRINLFDERNGLTQINLMGCPTLEFSYLLMLPEYHS